jgi:hypothetical protein
MSAPQPSSLSKTTSSLHSHRSLDPLCAYFDRLIVFPQAYSPPYLFYLKNPAAITTMNLRTVEVSIRGDQEVDGCS